MSEQNNQHVHDEEALDQDVPSTKGAENNPSDLSEEVNTVQVLETEIQELRDKYLRLFAEFDN